jgi:hypothetical protein
MGDAAFADNTLFMPDGGSARTDFPGGDAGELYDSITWFSAYLMTCASSVATTMGPMGTPSLGKPPWVPRRKPISTLATGRPDLIL